MKKHIWLLTVLIIVTLFCCVSAMAAEIVASGTCGAEGDNLTWELDNEGVLSINGIGEMEDWAWNGSTAPWLSSCLNIKKVLIAEGVTNISHFAFSKCSNLTSITIPNSISSIGAYAFDHCSSLTNVIIPSSVSRIVDNAFSCCTKLTSVTIPNSVTYIGINAFEKCRSLASVSLPESLTTIDIGAFYYCTKLTEINIPNSVTIIGGSAFNNCTELKSVTIGNSVNNIEDAAFANCSNLTSIIIPDGVNYLGNSLFINCSSLASIVIPNSVKDIGSSAFYSCSKLQNIRYCGTTVQAKNVVIGSGNSILTNIAWVCNDGKVLHKDFPHEGTTSNGLVWKYTMDKRLIISGEGEMEETPWDSYNNFIKTIVIEQGVTSIASSAFFGSNCLTNVTIPDSVVKIGSCAFSYCSNLTNIIIPDRVAKIGSEAFSGCNNLSFVSLPNSITTINYRLFFGCTSLTNITIPNNVTTISNSAFEGCYGLTNITLPNSVTSIGREAFRTCYNLKKIVIPDNVTSIGNNTFAWCERLVDISIPDSVNTIGENVFYLCNNLLSITIPPSITNIDEGAFSYSGIKKLFMPGTNEIAIGETAFNGTNPTVYCYEYTPNEGWARSKGFPVVLLDNLSSGDYISLTLPETDSVGLGLHKQLDAIVFPQLSEYEVEWSSSNPRIVTVDADGLLTGISSGTATITMFYGGMQASCLVTVLRPEEYITITLPETAIVCIGKQTYLEATVSPWVEELKQEWTSSDPSVVTVSMDGRLTGVSAGATDVTLSYGGVQAVCHVTVVQYAEDFSLPDLWLVSKTSTNAGSLITSIEPSDSVVQFTWSTENSIFATVDNYGYVTAGAVGETTLTVTDELSGLSRTVAVHSCYPVTAIDLSLSENSVYQGTSVQATASVTMRTQNCENHLVTFSSGNPSIAEIDQHGNIQTFRPGTVTITATAVDNETISDSAELSVTKDFQNILSLPVSLTEIGSEAFAGLPVAEAVRIPENATSIADDAFSGSNVIIFAPYGSYAITWAQNHGFDYLIE